MIGHWEKRAGHVIERYDPADLDRAPVAELFDTHASDELRQRRDQLDQGLSLLGQPVGADDLVDEFAPSGLDGAEAVARLFESSSSPGARPTIR